MFGCESVHRKRVHNFVPEPSQLKRCIMEVHRYRKRTSDCSNYISSYIAVDSELHNTVESTRLDVPFDIDELEGDDQCTMRTYCVQLLQIPVIGEYRNNIHVETANTDLNRNVECGTPTFVVDIWSSCAKGLIEIVRITDKAYIAVSYCWEPWGEQFRIDAERCAESRALHKAPSSTVLEEHPGLISSLSRTCDISGYMKFLGLLLRTCTERYAWIDALCIPQYNWGVLTSELGRMGLYYSNCNLCFVLMGTEQHIIADVKTGSMPKWFSRAWTYQEHMLSSRCFYAIEQHHGTFLVSENAASLYGHLMQICILQRDACYDLTNIEMTCIVHALLLVHYQLTCMEQGRGWEVTGVFSEIGNRKCKLINDKLNCIYGLFGISDISSLPDESLEIAVQRFVYSLPATTAAKLINIDPRSNNFKGLCWFPLISNEMDFYVAGQLLDDLTLLRHVSVTEKGLSASAPSLMYIGYSNETEVDILADYGPQYELVPDRLQQLIHVKSCTGDYFGAITYDVVKMPCTMFGIITGKTRIQPEDDKKCGYVITVVAEQVQCLPLDLQTEADCKYVRKVGTLMLELDTCVVGSYSRVTFI